MSAVLVYLAIVIGSSLGHTRQIADAMLDRWAEDIALDTFWSEDTFAKIYDAVKEAGKEDFTGYRDPRDGGRNVPANSPETMEIIASVLAQSTTEHFRSAHPVLSWITIAREDIPQSVVEADVKSFFSANKGASYPYAHAVRLSAGHLKQQLDIQLPKVVFYSRLALAGIFAVLFLLNLTLIAVAAFSDIKIQRYNG